MNKTNQSKNYGWKTGNAKTYYYEVYDSINRSSKKIFYSAKEALEYAKDAFGMTYDRDSGESWDDTFYWDLEVIGKGKRFIKVWKNQNISQLIIESGFFLSYFSQTHFLEKRFI